MIQLLRQLTPPSHGNREWLTVPSGSEYKVISAEEVLYLRAIHEYTEVVTQKSSSLVTTPLQQMRERLDPEAFWHIRRGAIVNVSAIESIHRTFRGLLEINVRDRATFLPVSAAYAHRFRVRSGV